MGSDYQYSDVPLRMKEWMDENVVSSDIDETFQIFAKGPGLWK
jgi:hypothetical protein